MEAQPDEDHVTQVQRLDDLHDDLGIALKRCVAGSVERRAVRLAVTDVVEEDDPMLVD